MDDALGAAQSHALGCTLPASLAPAAAYAGWFSKRDWEASGARWNRLFLIALDVQLLLGVLLYFAFSPLALQAFSRAGVGVVMQTSELRYFAVEHLLIMVVAAIVAHAGSVISKRAPTNPKRFRSAAISATISVALILASVPWDRPLLRWLS